MELIAELKEVNLELESNAGLIKILNNINFQIFKGEKIALVGPSGSGKSSLLMVLAGLEKPSDGKINVLSKDLSELNENEITKFRGKNIGIIFQEFHLIPTMSALENVSLPLEIHGNKDAIKKAKNMLREVNLSHRQDHYPSQLSGGEQQRVAIARAMIIEPKILLADEPTGNLDTKNGQNITNLIFQLQKKNNTSLLLVTHDINLAKKCERIVSIKDGKIN